VVEIQPSLAHISRSSIMGAVAEVSDSTFTDEVLQSTTPVLVDFWAPWCGPCRAIAPMIEELANENKGSLKVVKVNVDENSQYATQYQIDAIPTLIIFKDGQEVSRLIGSRPESAYREAFESVLS